MAEYPDKQRSAAEYLEMVAELAPYFNDMIAGDVGVSVLRDGKYIACVPPESLPMNNRIGDPVKGKVSRKCLETGQNITEVISQENSPYGIAYVACALPFKDDGTVVGCVTTTQTVSKQERIISIGPNLPLLLRN
jgi:hypothetical protein